MQNKMNSFLFYVEVQPVFAFFFKAKAGLRQNRMNTYLIYLKTRPFFAYPAKMKMHSPNPLSGLFPGDSRPFPEEATLPRPANFVMIYVYTYERPGITAMNNCRS